MVAGMALNVGRNLKNLRLRRGLRPEEVSARAKKHGFSLGVSTVYDLEANKRRASEDTINALAFVYGMTYDGLVLWSLLGEFADQFDPAMLTAQINRLIRTMGSLDDKGQDELARVVEEWTEDYRRGELPPPD